MTADLSVRRAKSPEEAADLAGLLQAVWGTDALAGPSLWAMNEFGGMVQFYDGVPIGISDYISDAQTVGVNTDNSTIFAMQFGEGALAGLSAPGGLTVERVGSLETKDATRLRVKWYASLALFNTLKLAKLIGVRP